MRDLKKGGRIPLGGGKTTLEYSGTDMRVRVKDASRTATSSAPGVSVAGGRITVDHDLLTGPVEIVSVGTGRYRLETEDGTICDGESYGTSVVAEIYAKGGVSRLFFCDRPDEGGGSGPVLTESGPVVGKKTEREIPELAGPVPGSVMEPVGTSDAKPQPAAPVHAAVRRPSYEDVPFNGSGGPPPVRCHEIDWRVLGGDLQLLEVLLDPGETVIAEAGAMVWMGDGISFDTRLGDGSSPSGGLMSGILKAAGRMLSGETLFLTHFTNKSSGQAVVGFGAPVPGTVVPIDLGRHGQAMFQKGAFLAAAYGTNLSIGLNQRLGAGLFGGEGFIMQKVSGDGMVFVQAGGHVFERRLDGERIRLDTGCLVGYCGDIDYSVELSGGLKTMLFGGEGIALATLKGTGTAWIQSLPFDRLARTMVAYMPKPSSSSR